MIREFEIKYWVDGVIETTTVKGKNHSEAFGKFLREFKKTLDDIVSVKEIHNV